MREIEIADITLRNCENRLQGFKEKVETVRLLDNLNANVIETPLFSGSKTDIIFLHTIAGIVQNSTISVPVQPDEGTIKTAAEALCDFSKKAINIIITASTVQMEYLSHKKPAAMIETLKSALAVASKYFENTEVTLADATRAEKDFLINLIDTSVNCGASYITLCDNTGDMLPSEFTKFIEEIKSESTVSGKARLGISCDNSLHMAAACSISAAAAGADRIKTTMVGNGVASLKTIAGLFRSKGDFLGIKTGLNITVLENSVKQVHLMADGKVSSSALSASAVGSFNGDEDIKTIASEILKLGYDLSEEDISNVYSAFVKMAAKKKISLKDLDAIIASEALQVPPTYKLESYVVNIGNVITPMAHIKLIKNGEEFSGFNIGDGPIDAAFMAIEQIVGHHLELDDFQVQSVTRGHEALGSAIVKLRSNGKLYSGKGLSTDIVGASIAAYINALNKICFEEEA